MSYIYDGSTSPLEFDKEVSSDYLNSVLSNLSDETCTNSSSPQSNVSDQTSEPNYETLKSFATSPYQHHPVAQEMSELEMNNLLNQSYQEFSSVVEMQYTSPGITCLIQRA